MWEVNKTWGFFNIFFVMTGNIFGKNLNAIRTERKISQRKLGEDIGFSNQTVSTWENGLREPDFDTVVKIAKYFDVSTDFLFGLDD